jgi:hypothetical protein
VYARAVDQADSRLHELRQEGRGELVLAGITLAAAVVAAEVLPELAGPLFVGGLVVGALGVRAMWRRWDLLERLSGERDAYVIAEVRALASREATMERRQSFAALIRSTLHEARLVGDARVLAVSQELEELAAELEDAGLTLEPASAVACMRLVSDLPESPLLNHALPAEDLRSRLRQIRGGFTPRLD